MRNSSPLRDEKTVVPSEMMQSSMADEVSVVRSGAITRLTSWGDHSVLAIAYGRGGSMLPAFIQERRTRIWRQEGYFEL